MYQLFIDDRKFDKQLPWKKRSYDLDLQVNEKRNNLYFNLLKFQMKKIWLFMQLLTTKGIIENCHNILPKTWKELQKNFTKHSSNSVFIQDFQDTGYLSLKFFLNFSPELLVCHTLTIIAL